MDMACYVFSLFRRVLSYLVLVNLMRTAMVGAHSKLAIPYSWRHMCSVTTDTGSLESYINNVTAVGHVIDIACHVIGNESGVEWRLQTLRDWHRQEMTETLLFIHVECSNNGRISLPWPMKSPGLVGLVVSKCILTDKYADFDNPEISNIPDQLRVLEIRDSVWLSDGFGFEKITGVGNLESLSADYDCGQDSSIEHMVTSNVTDRLEGGSTLPFLDDLALNDEIDLQGPTDIGSQFAENVSLLFTPSNNNSTMNFGPDSLNTLLGFNLSSPDKTNSLINGSAQTGPENEYLELLQRIQTLETHCNYERLRILEESISQFVPVHHFSLMIQDARYPELLLLNMSHSGIRELPSELIALPRHFPKLEYLDLSSNAISSFNASVLPKDAGTAHQLTIDLRRNNITTLNLNDVMSWARLRGVFLDIRENPIHCSKAVFEMAHEMSANSKDFLIEGLSVYDYLLQVPCASPVDVSGKKLAELIEYDNNNSSGPSATTVIVGVVCGLVLGVLVVLLVLTLIKILRRRRFQRLQSSEKTSSTQGIYQTETSLP